MECEGCGEWFGSGLCPDCLDVDVHAHVNSVTAPLQAIVDSLPKTADGVPVVPGMEVWFWLNDETILVHQKAVQFVEDNQQSIMTSYGWLNVRHCYSTREAAEVKEPGLTKEL